MPSLWPKCKCVCECKCIFISAFERRRRFYYSSVWVCAGNAAEFIHLMPSRARIHHTHAHTRAHARASAHKVLECMHYTRSCMQHTHVHAFVCTLRKWLSYHQIRDARARAERRASPSNSSSKQRMPASNNPAVARSRGSDLADSGECQ